MAPVLSSKVKPEGPGFQPQCTQSEAANPAACHRGLAPNLSVTSTDFKRNDF